MLTDVLPILLGGLFLMLGTVVAFLAMAMKSDDADRRAKLAETERDIFAIERNELLSEIRRHRDEPDMHISKRSPPKSIRMQS